MVRATTNHGELRIEDNSFLRRGVCTMFDMAQVSYAFKTINLGVVLINNSVCKQTSGCGMVCV